MVKNPSQSVISDVQALHRSSAVGRQFLDSLAARQRDTTATTIDWIGRTFNISYNDALQLARDVAETGAAELYLGRRGAKTRLVWNYSCISVGQAASGESAELDVPDDPIADEDDEQLPTLQTSQQSEQVNFSIADAKRLLAQSLGVGEANIEITIKA